jgi:hypothetical protein
MRVATSSLEGGIKTTTFIRDQCMLVAATPIWQTLFTRDRTQSFSCYKQAAPKDCKEDKHRRSDSTAHLWNVPTRTAFFTDSY